MSRTAERTATGEEQRRDAGESERQERPGQRRRRRRRSLILYGTATLLALWVLIPVYLITIFAFTTRNEVYEYPHAFFPTNLSLDTMTFFTTFAGVLPALGRSVAVAFLTLVVTLAIGAPAGYALARFIFPGRNVYRLVVLSTRAFPIVILSIPLAVTFLSIGLNDTIWAVASVHTALALPFAVLITSSVFVGVPGELEEAALVYGCTPFQAFRKIVLPMALPGLAAAAVFTFVVSWNEVFAATILTVQSPTLPALVLSNLTASPLPFRFAAGWFLLAPSLVFIFFVRKRLLGLWGAQ